MNIIAKTALAAALLFGTGAGAVAFAESPLQGMSRHSPGGPAYVASRISEAFDVVSGMGADEADFYPLAVKGDLLVPLACFGAGAAQAECPDVAFQVPHAPSTVVETRTGNTSTLERLDDVRVSDVVVEEPKPGRIDAAFQVMAEMPQVAEFSLPMATKGDLPVSLACVVSSDSMQAGCTDTTYKGFVEPSFVVATSYGNTTTLTRTEAMTVADVFDTVFWDSGQSAVSE
jgi:hypothetical protein